jgi:outer membrane protein assembly factor BamB
LRRILALEAFEQRGAFGRLGLERRRDGFLELPLGGTLDLFHDAPSDRKSRNPDAAKSLLCPALGFRARSSVPRTFVTMPMLSAAAVLSLLTLPQEPAAWCRFRGPNGTGLAGGSYPVEIGPGKHERWSVAVPPGHSSPVLSTTRVFLTGLEGQELVTFALERKDGALAWKKGVPRMRETKFHPDNHSAAASVAVARGVVVAFFDEFGLVAYDHDGKELWRTPLGPFDNSYGLGASPVVVGDVVVLAVDQSTHSFVAAFALSSGKERWRVARPLAISGHVTPVVARATDGVDEVLLAGSFLLDAYDARSGERRWWLDGLPAEMKSVPVWLDGKLWVHGYASPINDLGSTIALPPFDEALKQFDRDKDGKVGAEEVPDERIRNYFGMYDLVPDGGLDRPEWELLIPSVSALNAALCIEPGAARGALAPERVRWQYHRGIPQLPAPLVTGDVYWMVADQGGLVTQLDARTGELLGKERLAHAVDSYFAAPVAGDGKVYVLSHGGKLSVLAAKKGFELLAQADFAETCYATPALEGGVVYLRTAAKFYAFGE